MKRISLLLPMLLAMGALTAHAQNFSVSASPRQKTLDSTTSFSITVTPAAGFKASVFLSAYCPTLPSASISIAPEYLNPPFTRSAILTIAVAGPKKIDTHDIIIEAKNGPDITRDTVSLILAEQHSAWRVYDKTNSPLTSSGVNAFVLDREKGVAWLADVKNLYRFDGTTWTSERWPYVDSLKPYGIAGLALDAGGNVWAIFRGGRSFMVRKRDSVWTLFSEPDSSTGFSRELIQAIHWSNPRNFSSIQGDALGNIWITGSSMLARFDGSRWWHYTPKNSPLPEAELHNFLVDRRGNVWIGSYYSLLRFDGTYWMKYSATELGMPEYSLITATAADTAGNILLNRGVMLIRSEDDTYLPTPITDPRLVDGASRFDDENHPWLATWSRGLWRYDGTQWWEYTTANSGLPSNQLSFVDIDRTRTVWIGAGRSLVLLDGTLPPSRAFLSAVRPTPENGSALAVAPNPVAGRGMVHVRTASRGSVRLSLCDPLGREVALLLDTVLEAGEHDIPLNSDALPAGTYFLHLSTAGGAPVVRPVIVAR